MSSEWLQVTLGDLVQIQHGWPFKSEFFLPDDGRDLPVVVAIGNFEYTGGFRFGSTTIKRYSGEYPPEYRLVPGEILLVMTCQTAGGEILGIPARIPNDGVTYLHNQRLGRVRICASSTVHDGFLYWLFLSTSFNQHLVASATGTKILHTAPSRIESFTFFLPPIAEQKAIASALDAVNDRIALLRETNATLEAIAQALFKSWFVDFDPVHAKARGESPQGMDDATAARFPDSFEESELGMIPKGWRVGTVSELGNVICGKTPPTSDPENYGDAVPFITIPDMHGLLAITSTSRALSIKGANSQTKKYLPAGSICVSCIATPGLVVQVTEPSQTNQQINSVVPFDKWGNSFPLFLLRRIGDKVRSGGSGGSVFHNLSKSGFERIQELLPDQLIANCFNQVVDPLVSKIIENQRQAQTLAQLRDTLLPKLISGQLRLPEAQVLLAEELP